jgi:osmotically inducible protein OsmC
MAVDKVLYRTKASATGGRDGKARTADGTLDFQLTVPKELGGPGDHGANPEKLFAAGYSACYLGALRFVAGKEKVTIPADASVTADVGIGEIPGGFGIDVELTVSIPGMDKAKAEDLVAKAHKVCPYSNAIRGNVEVRTKVT